MSEANNNLALVEMAEEVRATKTKVLGFDTTTEQDCGGLSKNQLRKLKKKEKWLAMKSEKRKHERDKRKKRHANARMEGLTLGPSRKALKRNSMKTSNCQLKVVIDCSFDSYMSEKDAMKLVKQLQSCYSVNRRAENPLQLYICGSSGKTQERLDNIGDCKNWDVNFRSEKYSDIFENKSLVYLSSESDNVLADLDSEAVYVIGGLVDHNHYKGLCYRLAEEGGISHAQLPISEYLQMKTRKVLTVNHVFEILLRYTETKNWRQSLCQVIPERKGATCLQSDGTNKEQLDEKDDDPQTENNSNGNKPEVQSDSESEKFELKNS